jgi:hypothetical protein
MSTIVSHLKIMIPSEASLTTPDELVEKWVEGFKRNARSINERRKKRIPHGEAFTQRVSGVSSKAYRQVINPAFVSRAGLSAQEIVNRQANNLKYAYKKYDDNLNAVYETVDGVEAKRFKEKVEQARQHYADGTARKTLPFTGIPGSRGVIAITGLWLTADPIVEGEITGASQILEGGPFMITKPEIRSGFKAALASRLMQAGAAIVDSGFAETIMKQQNDITNSLIQGFVNHSLRLEPFTTGGLSHVDYGPVTGVFELDILVTQK